MSVLSETIKDAVFFAKESPEKLATLLEQVVYPENLSADITIPAVSVANGTTLTNATALFPTSVLCHTAKGVPFEATITWGSTTTPTYDATTAGNYVLSGTLSNLPSFVTNTATKVAKATITVKAAS